MLKTLQANGYRLLNDFKADFGALTAIVGANACGKSTLLDCLGFVSHLVGQPGPIGLHGGLGSILSADGKQSRLQVAVAFDHSGGLPWASIPAEGTLAYSVELASGPDGRPVLLNEALGELKGILYLTNSPHGFRVYDHETKALVHFDQGPASPAGSSTPQIAPSAGTPEPPPEPIFRLGQMQYPRKYPILSGSRDSLWMFHIFPSFDVTNASPIRTQLSEIRPGTVLWPNGSNLGSVLHEILTRFEFREMAQEIREFIKAAYPQFEEITAETAYGGAPARVLVRVREKGLARPIEIWEFSDGLLRFLCLAVALLSPVIRSIVAIDEPEAGLHPKLLPILGDMIKAASERTQVIVTTHSPDLLNRFSVEDIAVMRREESRAVWERPGNRKALVRMLESTLGGTVGDLLRSGELEGAAK